ncbi:MAG: bifunctional nicotinamidase/pyrazinamidase [Elusimicrobia bacterium]|nr:bifunctional nicotinamidase/pyrazinamidase [Elusimicrobiota bacterium]
MSARSALILVDIQNDFVPGGRLAVKDGDRVVPVANRLLAAKGRFDRRVATQDWHPKDHGSFASNHAGRKPGEVIELDGLSQILWPDHCVQGSPGAAFHPALMTACVDRVFRKGDDPAVDSYSGFYDTGRRRATGLSDWLKTEGVERVYVLGLATDYCVKFTALDARKEGFETLLVEDGCRGVNLKPSDSADAIRAMKDAGVRTVSSADLLGS